MAVFPSEESETKPCMATPSPESIRSRADQLAALLGPDTVAAREDPRRPGTVFVVRPADKGRVAVGGQRDRTALPGGSNRSRANQLGPLLRELGQGQLR